jgi:hypothetical protein
MNLVVTSSTSSGIVAESSTTWKDIFNIVKLGQLIFTSACHHKWKSAFFNRIKQSSFQTFRETVDMVDGENKRTKIHWSSLQ